jgi:peptidoglycan/xylan/chitin deacetylase (PgdA/CDA1 family)
MALRATRDAVVKAVMYHYVRPAAPGLPHFPFLHLDDFNRQLDHFGAEHGFVSRREFEQWRDGGPAPGGVLLTFDDGLRDHVEFVLPALKARGVFGLFYIASAPARTGAFLDVHKLHLAIGRIGGAAALAWLEANAAEILPPAREREGDPSQYGHQRADAATKFLKQHFNWRLSMTERRAALDGLLDHAFAGRPPGWKEFYLDDAGIRALVDGGMAVGPHGHAHQVLASLSPDAQRREIETSCRYTEQAGGSCNWGYCYAYGSAAAITEETKEIVAKAGCPFAFSSTPGDIERPLTAEPRFALPRHNCNAFPHGAVSFNDRRASDV